MGYIGDLQPRSVKLESQGQQAWEVELSPVLAWGWAGEMGLHGRS